MDRVQLYIKASSRALPSKVTNYLLEHKTACNAKMKSKHSSSGLDAVLASPYT